MMPTARIVPWLCAALALPSTALAQRWSLGVSGSADLTLGPAPLGHGIVLADLRGHGVVRGGDVRVYLNTDTLHLGLEGMHLGDRLELTVVARGELGIAGLLPNYFRNGQRDPSRGFYASYVQGFAALKVHLPGDGGALELVLGGRRWHFARTSGTSPELVLPTDTFTLEPRLRYITWHLRDDDGEFEPWRSFPRIQGVAAGIEAGVDVRAAPSAWGSVGATDDGRNRPGALIYTVRQWLVAGVHAHPRWRVQLAQAASWGSGEDDLTRPRAGALTPYALPLPGLPWPSVLSERHVHLQASAHFRAWPALGHEFGLLLAGGLFNDVAREGRLDAFGGAGGAAVFADLRWPGWQVHTRVGLAAPVAWLRDPTHVDAFVSVGKRW
ncbi:MAG: hypothetical protein HY909_31640 [Deltaproteobacteria bacterium]|nr:hypothetical protein [Deltaproteobacteria bacterium]